MTALHGMALREFTDEQGIRWRAWDILPDQLHPSTRVEDYMQGFFDGWIAFEAVDGVQRARLSPVPARWAEGTEEDLRALLARAERPRRRTGPHAVPERELDASPGSATTKASGDDAKGASGESAVESDEWSGESWPRVQMPIGAGRSASAPPGTIRTFRYPGGRYWSVYEQQLADRIVLRFSSGNRVLDLLAWPARWYDHADDELVELLWRAFPRDRSAASSTPHRRRRGDSPEARP